MGTLNPLGMVNASAGGVRHVGSALKGIIPGMSRPPKTEAAAAADEAPHSHSKRGKVKRMLGLGKSKDAAAKEA